MSIVPAVAIKKLKRIPLEKNIRLSLQFRLLFLFPRRTKQEEQFSIINLPHTIFILDQRIVINVATMINYDINETESEIFI